MANAGDYLILGLIMIVQICLLITIFNFVHANTDDNLKNRVIINISEVLTLIVVTSLVMYVSLLKIVRQPVLGFLLGFAILLIVVVWSVFRIDIIKKFFDIDTGLEVNNDNSFDVIIPSDTPKKQNVVITQSATKIETREPKQRSEKDFVVFSKYIDRSKENNFSFNNLYPNYGDMAEAHSIGQQSRDYSAYNGYPDDHICNGCGCLRREDGYKFCGKFIPGMGTIGCSPRWGCLNCRDCEEGTNTIPNNDSTSPASEDDYSCLNCKCHDTDAGYICGKVDRTDGYVHKCDSSCPKCDRCYGADGTGRRGGFITVDPNTSLDNVKVESDNRILDLLS